MLKEILIEEAHIRKILRGKATNDERSSCSTAGEFCAMFPNMVASLSGVELEMLYARVQKAVQ